MNGLLKSIIAACVLSAWMGLPSCTPKFDSDMSLQQEANELQQRTIPSGSRLVSQHPLSRQGWGANASWEFDSKYAPDSYHRWVTSKLRPDYRVGETANSGLRFSKYAHGDEETLSLETASSSGTLHVAVKLEIYPD
ncbi:MAG: hypothetical protein ABSF71_21990 [Terriglobia bacterium]